MTRSDIPAGERVRRSPADYWELSRTLFAAAATGSPLREFAADIGRALRVFTGAARVEVWLRGRTDSLRCILEGDAPPQQHALPDANSALSTTERHCLALLEDDFAG